MRSGRWHKDPESGLILPIRPALCNLFTTGPAYWGASATAPTTFAALVSFLGASHYYRLNEASGTTALDSGAATHINGTYAGGFTLNSGAIITGDVTANSVAFNGSTGDVTMASAFPSALYVSASFSIAAVLRAVSVTSNAAIFSCGSSGPYLRVNASGKLDFVKSNVTLLCTSTAALSAATNYFVGLTFDLPSNTAAFYINHAQDSTHVTTPGFTASAQATRIAADTGGTGVAAEFFNGRLAEIAYFPRTLTSTQMTNLGAIGGF